MPTVSKSSPEKSQAATVSKNFEISCLLSRINYQVDKLFLQWSYGDIERGVKKIDRNDKKNKSLKVKEKMYANKKKP